MGCAKPSTVQVESEGDEPIVRQRMIELFDRRFRDDNHRNGILKPDELQSHIRSPPAPLDENILNRIRGSMMGLAIGDVLGAHVEFRPREYLLANPVTDFSSGGTWSLQKGQFTDDTSMSLCLAISLILRSSFDPYDQLVRYKWWYRDGYMSSTGVCFDIGAATRSAIVLFEDHQKSYADKYQIPENEMDYLSETSNTRNFNVTCGGKDAAGNGSLMRLGPVPLFFFRYPASAVKYAGRSSLTTHGDRRAYDACRFYAALIVAALNGERKDDLLSPKFVQRHQDWFGPNELHPEIMPIAQGSYKNKLNGYKDGIRGKGFVVNSLEAALWAFYIDENSFENGALAAVNLGDDTDTTAAIYGQLAGAYYGYKGLPEHWSKEVYAAPFIDFVSQWLVYQGEQWMKRQIPTSNI